MSDLALTIMDHVRDHGRVTSRDMVPVHGANPNTVKVTFTSLVKGSAGAAWRRAVDVVRVAVMPAPADRSTVHVPTATESGAFGARAYRDADRKTLWISRGATEDRFSATLPPNAPSRPWPGRHCRSPIGNHGCQPLPASHQTL